MPQKWPHKEKVLRTKTRHGRLGEKPAGSAGKRKAFGRQGPLPDLNKSGPNNESFALAIPFPTHPTIITTLQICNRQMTVMLDTGASVSIMGNNTLKQIVGAKVKLNPTGVKFRLADGKISIPQGSISLPFSLHGSDLQHTFVILKSPIAAVILGGDFMVKYGAKLDYEDQTLRLRAEGNKKQNSD